MTDRPSGPVLRSFLFTPANRPAAFDKALRSGADAVCLDLEDAVPPDGKAAARPAALSFLGDAGSGGPLRAIRINALSTLAGIQDLAALAETRPAAGLVLLAKAGSAEEVRLAAAVLEEAGSGVQLAALIETASGLAQAEKIANACPRLTLLMFGGVDLSADLGCTMASDTMLSARARIVQAARAAGRDVLDVPELDFRDGAKVAAAAAKAAANGFTGKAAIHPVNVADINAAFTPGADEIEEATAIVAAFEASETGLVVIGGKLIEAPVIKAMRRRLALAEAAGVL